MKPKIKSYIYSCIIALAVGGLSALITGGSMDIYKRVNTPPLSPPSILFPIVWSILYVLMGISAAIIYNTKTVPYRKKSSALLTYGLSLVFNFFWSIIFFSLKWYLFAFFWILISMLRLDPYISLF